MSYQGESKAAREPRRNGGILWAGAASFALSCALMAGFVGAQDASAQARGVPRTQLYWGDLHLHSNYSLDAYATGNTTITPELAYRYARGIPIQQPGLDNKIQIRRPLDFLAVTDHAEMLGLQVALDTRLPALLSTPWGQKLLEEHLNPKQGGVMRMTGGALSPDTPERREMMSQIFSSKVRSASWGDEVDAANRNYIPGKFTTLFGWEWTAMPGGKNLHRIVLANADGEEAKNFLPYDNSASMRPEDLFAWLAGTKAKTGIDFLAIPHNSNISGGLMFQMTDSDGHPISAEYARARALWEPLVEVTQSKGTSEVHPEISTTDEFADFEIRRKLLAGAATPADRADYARYALIRGLEIQGKVGTNPYKFGFVGGTDSHTGMSNVTESAFTGKLAVDMPLSQHYKPRVPVIFPDWEMSASGRVAAWATRNDRKSLFEAFKRKEVYATTGTRIAVRFFGGFGYLPSDANARDIAGVGYAKGIPMGGDLTDGPAGKAPTFLVYAVKDPLSGNLDRIQVVKGWLDAKGQAHEKVYDVAWSGARKPAANGKVPAVGNTVDLRTGQYTNSIGAVQLAKVWRDPDFKPGESAFYYLRVLEIPTPRHSLFDAVALGIDVKETKQPATIQERAYSSPIWYTPRKG